MELFDPAARPRVTFIGDCVSAISGISKCKDSGTVSPAKTGFASDQNIDNLNFMIIHGT